MHPKQTPTERAWRIRQLSLGVYVPNATPAERRAACERKQAAAQRLKEMQETSSQ